MATTKQLSKHTPGPWEYDRHLFRADESGYEHESYSICATSGAPYIGSVNKGQECGSDEAQANARLIAQAPEMYELAVSLMKHTKVYNRGMGRETFKIDGQDLRECCEQARRLKAEIDGV